MDFADAGEQNPAVGDPPATSMLNTAQLHDASPAPRPGQIQVETTSGQATSKPQPRPYLQGLMELAKSIAKHLQRLPSTQPQATPKPSSGSQALAADVADF
ncbi:hypothetical protein WJX72_011054 [[Myrmecia] bisecta]|uniref:Uncharacterized protein n=1 Tax=[Myrmecia] bisecta TaxID=41462 RepID=A0AAW1RA66_9CHLO